MSNRLTKSDAKKAKRLQAIFAYEYTGSCRKAAELIGVSHDTVMKYYNSATPEEIQAAKNYANDNFEKDMACIFNLAIQKMKNQLEIEGGVHLSILNKIAGTMADKLLMIRGLNKSNIKHEFDETKPLRIVWEDRNNGNGNGAKG